jgi:hypothetical protein
MKMQESKQPRYVAEWVQSWNPETQDYPCDNTQTKEFAKLDEAKQHALSRATECEVFPWACVTEMMWDRKYTCWRRSRRWVSDLADWEVENYW